MVEVLFGYAVRKYVNLAENNAYKGGLSPSWESTLTIVSFIH